MEIKTTTQIKNGLFRFDDNWVRVDDEYEELLIIFEACNDSRVQEIQMLLSKHLKKLSQSNPPYATVNLRTKKVSLDIDEQDGLRFPRYEKRTKK